MLLTDSGGGADKPIGIFTGDFIFVGDVGRPDLLESAVGYKGTAEQGANEMFSSISRFKQLPDCLQVWPAHGAGSACGKALGAVPSTTVGYEKWFNPSLQYTDEEEFVRDLLEGQPEPPTYFSRMKRINKDGPELLNNLPIPIESRSSKDLYHWLKRGIVIDTRTVMEYGKGHIPGSINVPFDQSFVKWAGWLVDNDKPLYVLTENKRMKELKESLYSIGIDRINGYMDVITAIRNHPKLENYVEVEPKHVREEIDKGRVTVLDVRNQNEWIEGHLPNAIHIMLGTLPLRLNEIPKDRATVVYCASGVRSGIAASILRANGMKEVGNLTGGFTKWKREMAASTV